MPQRPQRSASTAQRRPGRRPAQHHATGGRRALDARWLAYLHAGGDSGDERLLADQPSFLYGRDLLHRGEYHAAHEAFEDVWRSTRYPERLLCLALAKLTAGLEHAKRGNENGARRVLRDAAKWLRPFAPTYAGVDVGSLLTEASAGETRPSPK